MLHRLGRLTKKVGRGQAGITGLETAIILIAFVMVASVLAYVVLSAGLFSSQKAKEAIYTGLEETRSTVDIKGSVLAKMTNSTVEEVYFTVATVSSSEGVDFTDTTNGENVVVISYSDAYQQFPTVNWTMEKVNTTNLDNLLDKNELFLVTVDLRSVSENVSDAWKLGPYRKFVLEIKPPVGAVLTVERTVPARVTQIVNLR